MAERGAEALKFDLHAGAEPDILHPVQEAAIVQASCFHCGEPIPVGFALSVHIDGQDRPTCCAGCAAAARLIEASGLGDFYRHRTRVSPRIEDLPAAVRLRMKAFDHPRLRQQFERSDSAGGREVTLILERISCPACLWLIERVLMRQPGVRAVSVNHSTQRARLQLQPDASLAAIMAAVHELGYDAHPFQPSTVHEAAERERSWLLRRLGVAWVLGMQVMMVTGAFYFDASYIAPAQRRLLDALNLLLTAPVVFYSGQGFLRAGWRGLRHGILNMDLSVSLGVLLAFAGSAWTTLSGRGATYFDSVVMFISLLLTSRYLEFMARRRALQANERLLEQQPMLATRLRAEPSGALHHDSVAAVDLRVDDEILVRAGEVIPADAVVVSGSSAADESLLTGESHPVSKSCGSTVYGGSINIASPLQCRVRKVGAQSLFAGIVAAMEQAQAERPRLSALAERAAQWFVVGVLVSAVLTAVVCRAYGIAWFERVLAVLVVTCPCALALATPAAITNAVHGLMQQGVLMVRAQALEALAAVTHVVFDKTGTLTRGDLQFAGTDCLRTMTARECLRIAAALERQSEHPLGRALLLAWDGEPAACSDVRNVPGAGIEGTVDGRRWHLGDREFIAAAAGNAAGVELETCTEVSVWLASEQGIQCRFRFADSIRPEAAELIAAMHRRGLHTVLMSGDHAATVAEVAKSAGIESWHAELAPEDKLARVRELQQRGAIVMMVGDGINDAPVLAGAQVSVAMGVGSDLTKANADIVLLREDLSVLDVLLRQAVRTRSVIRWNIAWAIAYNVLTLPAAMLGWINPLFAAVGMSSSSLLVLANTWRLRRAG